MILKSFKENGGWYRDRTCDPYHVKVSSLCYLIEFACICGAAVRQSFPLSSRQSWAYHGRLPTPPVPKQSEG